MGVCGERLLSFFFCSFNFLFCSCLDLRGGGMKSSKPGGKEGLEIEEEEVGGFERDFFDNGLNWFERFMAGLLYLGEVFCFSFTIED